MSRCKRRLRGHTFNVGFGRLRCAAFRRPLMASSWPTAPVYGIGSKVTSRLVAVARRRPVERRRLTQANLGTFLREWPVQRRHLIFALDTISNRLPGATPD